MCFLKEVLVLMMRPQLTHIGRRYAADDKLRLAQLPLWSLPSSPDKNSLDRLDGCGALQHVMSYVGIANNAFISTVCKSWYRAYVQLPGVAVNVISRVGDINQQWIHRSYFMSAFSAAFESVARLKLASSLGLQLSNLKNWKLQRSAGRNADIIVLASARELGLLFTDDLMCGAAESGCLKKLQWLHTDQLRPLPKYISHLAVKSNNLEMLVWLRSLQCIFDQKTLKLAAAFCDIHTVTYLHSIGCPFDPHASAAAAERNDLGMMKFLKLNQCTWPHIAIGYHATYSGNIELMDWVQQQGCLFKTVSMKVAAKRCDCHMLQYLYDANCEWKPTVATKHTVGTRAHITNRL
jgi:hypothetical protein